MKISPYLQFNGNCVEAIAFYEKAFGVKAEVYKEADLISHAELDLGDGHIGLSDTPPGEGKSDLGNGGVSISVLLESVKEVKDLFEELSKGGKISERPEATDWCECFCTFYDKFGVNWSVMCCEK
ncbi:MAG: VOC family protein [Methanomassiliicoccaceae archaeon]|nr:VOC family protein [Methanomassiliicoccaceae archaeon]